jgi:hypothetical protein
MMSRGGDNWCRLVSTRDCDYSSTSSHATSAVVGFCNSAICLVSQENVWREIRQRTGASTRIVVSVDEFDVRMDPDGHFKLPHLWPPKLPQAGRLKL